MIYTVTIRPAANRDAKGIPKKILQKIDDAIKELATEPRPAGIEQLEPNTYRRRVGEYRFVYVVNDAGMLPVCVPGVMRVGVG